MHTRHMLVVLDPCQLEVWSRPSVSREAFAVAIRETTTHHLCCLLTRFASHTVLIGNENNHDLHCILLTTIN